MFSIDEFLYSIPGRFVFGSGLFAQEMYSSVDTTVTM